MITLTYIQKTDNDITAHVTLTYEQRTRSRLRVELDNAAVAAIYLERGQILKHHDLLQAEDGSIVQVLAADEKVSSITTDDHLLLARACYHLGNRHVALQITSHQLTYLHDHVLDDMVQGLGLTVALATQPFHPEAGAYGGGHGHQH